ncbi:MAG: DNA cytosine methyltransferase [Chloroflexaceae bacterium]|nr:DNA cytosine methyltransferase [Chloroflexaceae bacterium]
MSHRDEVIALFSGAGGLSLGFCQAGLKPVIAVDIDADACQTYQTNLDIEAFHGDLSKENTQFNQILARVREPLAIIGGPPCQGFSSAGLKDRKDDRNRLIFYYLSIVEKTRPQWFLFENVEGLLTSNGGQSVTDLVRELVNIGYRVRLEKINLAAYGLPQGRKRVMIVGNRIGIDFAFPVKTHSYNAGKHKSYSSLPWAPTVDDALSGLGQTTSNQEGMSTYAAKTPIHDYDALMRRGNPSEAVSLHFSSVSAAWRKVFSMLQPGQTMKDLPEEYWHHSYKKRAFRRVMDGTPTERRGGAPSGIKRLFGDLNALTITSAAPREFIHPHEDRPLTLREAARLQSFPDHYRFAGSVLSIARQIGNAFPPLFAEIFANHLIMLEGAAGSDTRTVPEYLDGSLIGYHLTDAEGMSPALARTDTLLASIMYHQSTMPLEHLFVQESL